MRPRWGRVAAVVGLIVRRAFGWFAFATVVAMIPLAFDIALLGTPDNSGDWWALIGALLVWLLVALVVGIMVARLGRFARPSPPDRERLRCVPRPYPSLSRTASMVDYRAKAIRDGSRIHASDSISCWI